MNRQLNEIAILWFACGIVGAIILTMPWEKPELLFKSKSLRHYVTYEHTKSTFYRKKGFIMQLCQDAVYP